MSLTEEQILHFLRTEIEAGAWRTQPTEDQFLVWSNNLKEAIDDGECSEKDLKQSFKFQLRKEKLADFASRTSLFLQQGNTTESQKERQDFGISRKILETKLTHNFDVNALAWRIVHVFETFYNQENKDEYLAPYICFVQSSGMGKTKIIFELKKSYERAKEPITAKLVLCRVPKEGDEGTKEREIFDKFLDCSGSASTKKFKEHVREWFAILDEVVAGVQTQKIVVLFDEAHYLLHAQKAKESIKDMQAFYFRLIRLWIRKKRPNQQVVAVFTGTTSSLTNFIIKDDLAGDLESDTREHTEENLKDFYKSGCHLYDPFFTTTTIGCLRFSLKPSNQDEYCNLKHDARDEYWDAVKFGRPLFAVMTKDELSAFERTAIKRIIKDTKKWEELQQAWVSVLGIRAQMGQTLFSMASDLVGYSYANLVGVNIDKEDKKSAKIFFPPDPVCARLAMCLMDKDWSLRLSISEVLQGKDKKWWIDKMMQLYSKNICAPEKGNFGEVMVALYFLFCADSLRKAPYTTFSVPFDEWVQRLIDGGSNKSLKKLKQVKKKLRSSTKESQVSFSFGAIQVCRNYIRAYEDWSYLCNETFLENIYKSGVGFYVFAGCGAIDLVFALKRTENKEGTHYSRYIPMFVSVKSHVYLAPKDAQKACNAMTDRVENQPLGAFCLLVVFGSDSNSNDGEFALRQDCVKELAEGGVLSRVLRVPTGDAFGLSKAFLGLATMQDEMTEVLSSHSFLSAHLESDKIKVAPAMKEFAHRVLRLRPKISKDNPERKSDAMTDQLNLLLVELEKTSKEVEESLDVSMPG